MKKIIKIFILLLPLFLINIDVSAATRYSYNVKFNYECYKKANTSSGLICSGNDVSYINIPNSKGRNGELNIVLKGNKNSYIDYLENNGYINSDEINIIINTNYEVYYIYLYDGNNNEIEVVKNNILKIDSLFEGNYKVKIICNGPGINESAMSYYFYETICYFNFTIDLTKPTIIGASNSMSGKYVKNKINIEGQDLGSGIKSVYMLEPGGYTFQEMNESFEFSSSLNGLFTFYAIDNAGNRSNMYYINNDTKIPNGFIRDNNGNIISDETTSKSFYYSGIDNDSGINKMQYLTPGAKYWKTYNKQIIDETYSCGLYQFRSVDNVGNYSDIISIYYDHIEPIGYFYNANNEIINNKKTNSEYIIFKCSDNNDIDSIYMKYNNGDYAQYNNETKLYNSGVYEFYIIDVCGNKSSVYNIELDNTIPIVICDSYLYSITEIPFTISVIEDNDYQLYYKTPSMKEYELYDKLYYDIMIDDEEGKYYFYAIDSFNNKSDIVWIVYNKEKPMVEIRSIENTNKVFLTWNNPNYEVTVNSMEYNKEEVLYEEGTYDVSIKNEFGNTSKLSFDISCFYVYDRTIEPNCIENGYTVYKCISCEKEIYTDETSEGTHVYDTYFVDATCDESGGIYFYCIKCGYGYMTDIIAPTGHNYKTNIYDSPKCSATGLREYKCRDCGNIEYEIINALGHDYYKYKEIKKNNDTYIVYKCKRCGIEKQEKEINDIEIILEYANNIINKYFPYIITIMIITSSIWSLFMGIKIIVAKKNDEKDKAYKMIKNYIIGLIVIFILLVALPYILKLIINII